MLYAYAVTTCTSGSVSGNDVKQEYFTDVTLTCVLPSSQTPNAERNVSNVGTNDVRTDSTKTCTDGSTCNHSNIVHVSKTTWLLPNGELIFENFANTSKFSILKTEAMVKLKIHHIDDPDFGVYFCLFSWNDSSLTLRRFTLNIDGADMTAFYERQKRNAMVGGISGAVMLAVIVLTYAIWRVTCSERVRRRRRLTSDLAKGVDRYSTSFYDNVGFEHYAKKPQS